jgi:formylglycine-generating enzyme required for sulfatase activity
MLMLLLPIAAAAPKVDETRIAGGSYTRVTESEESKSFAFHEVELTHDFYIMRTEVSQDLYKEVVGRVPTIDRGCGSDCPVGNMSWFDAVDFANRLSLAHGLEACYRVDGKHVEWPKGHSCIGWRLPTEAEWEFASKTEPFISASSHKLDEVVWYSDSSGKKMHPPTSTAANGRGVYDMDSNIWEWCWDWMHSENPIDAETSLTNPSGPHSGIYRVSRGGEMHNFSELASVAYRFNLRPTYSDEYSGIRLLRTVPTPTTP